ncbi:MAG: triose-phosphate isomerase [Burkholderiales bacterium]|nr:triose-phosphate isomerase [Bacteroidia bacterium]
MNRQKIVAGNWKMNTTLAQANELVTKIVSHACGFNQVKAIIFPPFPFITEVKKMIGDEKTISVGAQNCHTHSSGAYTGEVSAGMLHSVGCQYVLIGHSERRNYFKEKNSDLVLKIKEVLANKLQPILCVGETFEERKAENHFKVIIEQLTSVLSQFSITEFSQFIIAYEPVWAIGTGETASNEQAQEIHAFIRSIITDIYDSAIANNISILYGGSCNAQNAKELFQCPDIDGGLIGGASLKADDFCQIIGSF